MKRLLLVVAAMVMVTPAAFSQTPVTGYDQRQLLNVAPMQPIILDANALKQVCLMPSPDGKSSVMVSPGFKACSGGDAVVCVSGHGWVPASFPHPC